MQRIGDLGNPACLLHLNGNVEIRTSTAVVQADEADYHCDTGEVEPRGNVHMNFVPQQ
jgi:lipopolysaccharide assembly outer membrane protein LptD (OstA)